MIWRILGLIGAGSFFVNGFSLLSDPSCVSADFGGGRVIQVTCRSDSYGTFSGTQAGLISLFIGIALLTFIFFNQIKQFFNKSSSPSEWKSVSVGNPDGLVDIKICDYCEDSVPLDLQKCPQCEGTYFNYKKVSSGLITKPDAQLEVTTPENLTKKCPMCAEEIKVEAMKCRFCQHSFVETGVQKFNNSTSTFFKKAFSKQYLPLTFILIIIIIVGLGFGFHSRSQAIQRSQLLASGQICVVSESGNTSYGCADYPNFVIGFCSDAPYSDLNFRKDYLPIGEKLTQGVFTLSCGSTNPYNYKFEGTTDKLIGDYEIQVWDYTKYDWTADDFELGATFSMEVRLKK